MESDQDFGSFKSFEKSAEGKMVFDFLSQNDNLIRMMTATELKRPAVEGVQMELKAQFGKLIKSDDGTDSPKQKNIRKWIGRMIKIIMEENGYKIHGAGAVRLLDRENNVFKTGTKYTK